VCGPWLISGGSLPILHRLLEMLWRGVECAWAMESVLGVVGGA
jgi:hypothetical protein